MTLRAWGGFFVVMALVGGAALSVGQRLEGASVARRAVEASGDRLDRIDLLLRHMLETEVGQRGYIISGDERFLEPYRTSVADVPATMRAIADDALPSREQQAHSTRLQQLVTAKLEFIDRTIELRRTQGFAAAQREVATFRGKRLMDAIRAELERMSDHERAQLAARSAALQGAEARAQRLIFASLVGALVLVLAIGLMLLRQLQARIQAQRAARQAATLLRVAFDNIGAGVFVIDADGQIVTRNAELLRMLPETAESEVPPVIAAEIDLARSGQPFLFEREIAGAAMMVRGVPLPGRRFLVSFLDITAARRAEQVKSEFVTTVSHELRTPVTSIRGALGMLAGPLAAGLSEKQVPLVDMALRNAERLTLLVNDILDIEKIESGRMVFDFQACDLNQLLRDAAETNRAYADARDVVLALGTLPRPLLVWADPLRIQQVMSNLVSNAVKFSDPKGIVTITAEQNGRLARVAVQDHGPGVPDSFKAQIFERFAQADASDARAKGGTGLGLSIAKAIVEKHGGTLGFESAPGDTRFMFTVPLCSPDQEPA